MDKRQTDICKVDWQVPRMWLLMQELGSLRQVSSIANESLLPGYISLLFTLGKYLMLTKMYILVRIIRLRGILHGFSWNKGNQFISAIYFLTISKYDKADYSPYIIAAFIALYWGLFYVCFLCTCSAFKIGFVLFGLYQRDHIVKADHHCILNIVLFCLYKPFFGDQ